MNKRKKKNKKENSLYVGELTAISEKDRYPILVQLCQAPWATPYDELAIALRMNEKKTRQLIEDFQLFQLNPYSSAILEQAPFEQLSYLYPTIAQFYTDKQRGYVNELDILKNVLSESIQRPHSKLIKRNVLIRYLYMYQNWTNKELAEKTGNTENYVSLFKKEFTNVISSQNSHKIWHYGVKCGLHDKREKYRCIVKYLCHTYFYMVNNTYWLDHLAHKNTGDLTEELNKSLYNIVRMINDYKNKLIFADNTTSQYKKILDILMTLIQSAELINKTNNRFVLRNVGLSTY